MLGNWCTAWDPLLTDPLNPRDRGSAFDRSCEPSSRAATATSPCPSLRAFLKMVRRPLLVWYLIGKPKDHYRAPTFENLPVDLDFALQVWWVAVCATT